jgi:hypothetical protein
MARRVGSRSFGRHRAWLLTENREEQVQTQDWIATNGPPNLVTSRTAPGDEASPPGDWNRHRQDSHVTKR